MTLLVSKILISRYNQSSCLFQTLEFDLGGVAISGNDQLEITVKDWERVGRNRYFIIMSAYSSVSDMP